MIKYDTASVAGPGAAGAPEVLRPLRAAVVLLAVRSAVKIIQGRDSEGWRLPKAHGGGGHDGGVADCGERDDVSRRPTTTAVGRSSLGGSPAVASTAGAGTADSERDDI